MPTLVNNIIKLTYTPDNRELVIDEMIDFKIDKHVRESLMIIGAYLAKKSTLGIHPSEHANDIESNRSLINEQTHGKRASLFSYDELERLADSFLLSQISTPCVNLWEQELRATFNKANALIKNYDLSISLATYLVRVQHTYLKSRNWMDKKKLTFLQVASFYPSFSESTIRRRIQTMRLMLDNWQIPASDLLCANNLPFTCKQVTRVLACEPRAGRPRLFKLLHDEGYLFSDGQIKNAMGLLHAVGRDGERLL